MNGPAAPNALLLQRLDAVLGVPLSKYARPAAAPFPLPERPGQETAAHPGAPGRTAEDATQAARHAARRTGPADPSASQSGPGTVAGNRHYPSSPTTLGQAARTILALLQQLPQSPPALTLRQPLLPAADRLLPQGLPHATPTGHPPAPTLAAGQNAGMPAAPLLAAQSATQSATKSAAKSAALPNGLSASSPLVALLAQHLMRLVNQSGMFYEAQLARVAFDGQPADTLRQQPQAEAHASHPSHPASSGPAASATQGLAPNSPAALTSEHAMLVRQQLEVLASQTWQAKGEAWPGAPMQWDIQRAAIANLPAAQPATEEDSPAPENEAHGQQEETTTGAWKTRLRLQLPRLGAVDVTISLHGQQCALHLESALHGDTLRQGSHALQQQLSAAGLALQAMQITTAATPDQDGA